MESVVVFKEIAGESKSIAIATLNAPKSLNALSLTMINLLLPKLLAWQKDPNIATVFIDGAGDKAFCAGGDIVHLYDQMKSNPSNYTTDIESFFTQEYKLDYLIHTFSKPIIVWGSGIIMGGGMGLFAGASHRIVTESTRMAMPEISIGLYPDVGASWYLSRLKNNIGLFLGLTGASLNAADLLSAQLADAFLLNQQKQLFIERLAQVEWTEDLSRNNSSVHEISNNLKACHKSANTASSNTEMPTSMLNKHQALINSIMGKDNLIDIVDELLSIEIDDQWFNRAQRNLRKGSAISAHLASCIIAKGKKLSLADCFRLELTVSLRCAQYGEFEEGVRALLIDKDNKPNWKFSDVKNVDEPTINSFFDPIFTNLTHPLRDIEDL